MEILYEDHALTVAVKPPALLSEQSPEKNGFADLLAERNPSRYIGVIHRLDRGVGGVMVYARTPKAAASLSAAVQAHAIKKEYLAIVHGIPKQAADEWRDLLFHDRTKNKTFVVDRTRRGVKEAILSYEVLSSRELDEYGMLSLVRVRLQTGRTHQIRVQFSSRGYPLLGDGKYGAHDKAPMSLFSHKLSFLHPESRKALEFCKSPTGFPWELLTDEAVTTL